MTDIILIFYRNGKRAIIDRVGRELRTVIIPDIWEQEDIDWISEIKEIVFSSEGMDDRLERTV